MLLLASKSLNVQRSAPLVLGNIAQNEENRDRVGEVGGVEALFLALDNTDDYTVRRNCLWALSNLAWNSSNQERIGRFFEELLDLCDFPDVSWAGPTPKSLQLRVDSSCLCYSSCRTVFKHPRCVCWPTPCSTTRRTAAGLFSISGFSSSCVG